MSMLIVTLCFCILDESDVDDDLIEPDYVADAWDELMFIQEEQARYNELRAHGYDEWSKARKQAQKLEQVKH